MIELETLLNSKEKALKLAEILKGVAHPLRLRIITALIIENRNVTQLSELLETRQSLVSQHLAVLRMLGLISADRSGGTATYFIVETGLKSLVNCLLTCKR